MIKKNGFLPAQPLVEFTTLGFHHQVTPFSRACAQYYTHEVSKDADQKIVIVPDGTIDILFKISDSSVDSHVCGAVKKATLRRFNQGCSYFGVRLKPGTANKLIDLPIDIITEDCIESNNILKDVEKLKEGFINSRSFKEKVFLFEEYLNLNINDDTPTSSLVSFVLEYIHKKNGELKMKELSELTHYTSNYIYKCFLKETGVSPKHYARVVRFQSCLNLFKESSKTNLTGIASESGYYDQAHFINEFKEFTSFTPTQLQEFFHSL
ncbi:helix-turn-helix domain-containing protein [Rhodanobacter aciditrophus]|uniref:Helix-turn-helix domain-containing protein n=1 Tax=Rhodanobacter aciditrophus TaxID=1623218 RepID=A0ABW4B4H9_9GAMM